MRTLTRPMFNMGGPIKQGVMHGIREPKKDGGPTGTGLVGDQRYPKTAGREHHAAFLAPLAWAASAARAAPMIWRGMRTAKTLAPGKLGFRKRFMDIFSPSGRFRNVAGKKGTDPSSAYMKGDFTASAGTAGTAPSRLGIWQALKDPTRFGMALRENPLTAFGAASMVPQAGALGYKVAKATPGAIWKGTKRYADMVIPGDQSHWYTDPEPPKGIEKPGGYPKATVTGKGSDKPLTEAQQEKWADAQRTKRLDNLLDIMGYDRSKKTAIADALIDASKIVSDRGTLDKKNITAELINPIIQATSKRLDKPDQIREAVGLMMAKGEIEKDLYKWKPGTHLKNAQDMADTLGIPLEEAFNRITSQASTLGEEMQGLQVLKKGTALTNADVEKQTRVWADKKKKKFKKNYTATDIKEAGLDKVDAVDIVSESITGPDDDGYYVIGTEVVEVINGVPKRAW